MGEVYRARDTRLNRDVAIKVLPDVFAADSQRLARFKQEAQVLASLNHPNIGTIYGFEESDGRQALVLELVDGRTLEDRIRQGPMPLDEALPVARQIAEALEAAREQRVIHRDLKPANIKLRPNGTVKVLDFGLAKLVQASDPEAEASTLLSQSPTITSPAATRLGAVMGTPAYMSPEQARGMPVDWRTDVWAFGCVLFEMLSGRSAFGGETISDTIAKILEREPDWHALPASTPARIRELLRRCLQKDQRHRLHDISDVRIEIDEGRSAASRSRRVVGLPAVAAGGALAFALLAGAWWYAWRSTPAVPHEPVSVVIADFQNRTDDPTFDHTLEPVLRIVLEGAGFITAYDRTLIGPRLGVPPPEQLDEIAARQIAVKQGLGVVLSGSLERQAGGYRLSVRAVQAVTGDVIGIAEGTVSDKDRVLSEATRLVTTVREALGDDASDSAQRFAMETLSATSLEVVREYAEGTDALSRNKSDEALQSFSRAVALDPSFGLGHASMAIASRNLDRQQDAERYIKEAVRHVDGMTERERYRTRGLFYYITGDYQACVKEYGDLVARYAADVGARNNLALCLTYLRNLPQALDEIQRAVAILPKRALYRLNFALYAAYAGDFQTAEQEARTAQELGSPMALLSSAFAQLGRGQLSQAAESYQQLAKVNDQGASFAAAGLADLALYEGRLSEAVGILEQGAAAALAAKDPDRAANRFAALGYAQLVRGQRRAAVEAADTALANSQTVKIRFLAARVFVEAGEMPRASTVATSLASELQAEPQAYAKIINANAALKNRDPRLAIKTLIEANGLLDTWIGHYDLGRAYFGAGAFTQADSEFDRCLTRRGEALALFLDEEPTYGYLPPVYYYQGRVREALNSPGIAEPYRTYLTIRGTADEDPLLAEVRRRIRGSPTSAP